MKRRKMQLVFAANNAFTFGIDTTNTSVGSSTATQFALPLISSGSYDMTVDWGDGSSDDITVWDAAETTHTYNITDGINLLGDAAISNAGSTTLVVTGDSFNATGASDSGTSLRPRLLWSGLTVGEKYRVRATFTVNSGTTNMALYDGTSYVFQAVPIADFDEVVTCNSTNFFFALDGTNTFDVDADFFIEKVVEEEYTIKITGTCQGWQFNNGGDKLKMLDISKWGVLDISTNAAFFGCSNLTVSATDAPIISTNDLSNTFRSAGIGSINMSAWDFSGVTLFTNFMLSSASAAPTGLENWDISSATRLSNMFFGTSINQNLSSWDITSVTLADNFMNNVITLSTANYDALLIGWEATLQGTYPAGAGYTATISVNFGGSTYTAGGAAATARASLVSTFGWTITDGGTA